MPSLDELEHDSNEDAAKGPHGKPVKGKPAPDEPEPPGPPDLREPWLSVDNPAIWVGDVDDD
jgi:hypothetical protein